MLKVSLPSGSGCITIIFVLESKFKIAYFGLYTVSGWEYFYSHVMFNYLNFVETDNLINGKLA